MKKLIFCPLLVFACLCACRSEKTNRSPEEVTCLELPVNSSSILMYNSNYPTDSLLYFYDVENRGDILACRIAKDGVVVMDTVKTPTIAPYYEMFVLAYDSIASISHKPFRTMTLTHNDRTAIGIHSIESRGPYVNDISQQPRHGNTVYFANTDDSIAQSGVLRSDFYRAVKPVYEYDLASGTGKSWGVFPNALATALGFEETPTICVANDTSVVLSFMCVDSLYLYVNGELKSRHCCRSRYIGHFPEYDTAKVFDLGYYRQFTQSRPEYLNLLHNPTKQCFYRIALHEDSPKGRMQPNTPSKRTWSVMVINKDLEVVSEHLFRFTEYYPFVIAPDFRGLWVGKTPESETDTIRKISLLEL